MFRTLRLALLICLTGLAASAFPLHWQLNGATFTDGGSLFGGFDYDADTNTYSNVNVTSTPGGVLTGSYYNFPNPVPGTSTASQLESPSTLPVFPGTTIGLLIAFSAPLSDAGGTVALVASGEALCTNASCTASTVKRTLISGALIAVSSSAPKRWSIQGPYLSDGGQVFGSFVYDANAATFLSVSITTTGGSAMPGRTYTIQNASIASSTSVSAVSASTIIVGTTNAISITWTAALTNAGGSTPILTIQEGTCASANCSLINALRTVAVPGILSTTFITGDSRVIPQIADGGGFVTVFIITNPTGASITCRLIFFGDNGSTLALSLNGGAAAGAHTVVVPGHSTKFLSTPGTGGSTTGWALAENVSSLGVIAAYRLQLPGIPESEATVEAIDATAGFSMAFDETPGFDTGFGLANFSANDTVIENLFFYDTTGALIFSDTSRTLGPHQHESFLFSGRYAAQLAGKQGTVRVYYGTTGSPTAPITGLTGVGLRVNPGNTFTSLPIAKASTN